MKSIKINVNKFDEAKKLAQYTLDTYGQIDVLVNIAGGSAGVFLKTKHSHFFESTPEHWQSEIPLGRIGEPEEIASMVTFLSSDAANYISGANIPIDGGLKLNSNF